MSVPFAPEAVSNPRLRPWLITVIVVLVLASAPCAQIIGAYSDVAVFLTLLLGGGGTEAMYRNHSNRP